MFVSFRKFKTLAEYFHTSPNKYLRNIERVSPSSEYCERLQTTKSRRNDLKIPNHVKPAKNYNGKH